MYFYTFNVHKYSRCIDHYSIFICLDSNLINRKENVMQYRFVPIFRDILLSYNKLFHKNLLKNIQSQYSLKQTDHCNLGFSHERHLSNYPCIYSVYTCECGYIFVTYYTIHKQFFRHLLFFKVTLRSFTRTVSLIFLSAYTSCIVTYMYTYTQRLGAQIKSHV